MSLGKIHRQGGLAGAAAIVILIVVVLAFVLGRSFFPQEVTLEQRGATDASMRRIADAVIAFAVLNKRLPCPADGAASSGLEDRTGGDCDRDDGTVPWESLAISREVAVDGWGRRISYRVLDGPQGFTRDGSIDATDCNRDVTATGTAVSSCNSSPYHTNHRDDFLLGKGLTVNDVGTAVSGVAFVLIGHGESGRGAFGADSGIRTQSPNASGSEFTNTQGSGTFQKLTRNIPTGVPDPASDATHFDDEVVYMRAIDLIQKGGLDQRAWTLPPPPTFGADAITTAGGAVDYNTGQSTLNFGAFTVTAYGDTARNVSFDVSTGAGIGTIGSGVNADQYVTLNRETNEGLRFVFTTTGRYLGVTLSRFGDASGELERVSFDFVIGGSNVRVTKLACRAGNGRVNFTVNPGGDFSEVAIEPRLTQGFNFYSTFLVADIALCPSSNPACQAPSAIPAEDCP